MSTGTSSIANLDDNGKWFVELIGDKGKEKVCIASTDFEHDVWLYVTGDFEDLQQKVSYAEKIADRLNRTRGWLT